MNKAYRNKVLGSMIGGAIGDALGYPVEFMSYSQIIKKYGVNGITRYELNHDGVAEISDDTQMSLFTANGVLFCFTRYATYGCLAGPADYIRDSYIEWLQTQTGEIDYTKVHYNWIREVKDLHARRAPGLTCMSAISKLANHQEVDNYSKGCGGIMRVAPLALYVANPEYQEYTQTDVAVYAEETGKIAALTHKHPLGYIPAAFLSALIQLLMPYSYVTTFQLREIIDKCMSIISKIYPEHKSHIEDLRHLVDKAIRLSVSKKSDAEAISELGEGWVAEETLAIALYCVLKYHDDFEKAIIASVNHSGDSDSTGAVTGNILGALLGYDQIPDFYKENLELKWLIEEVASDLANGVRVDTGEEEYKRWMRKYVEVIERDRTPVRNSYPVHADLNIFAGEYPGDKNTDICRAKVQDCFSWSKIKYFYDLTCEGELSPYAHFLGEDKCHFRFPIPDCGVPKDTTSVARLCQEMIYRGQNSSFQYNGIYIHCWGGVGRTGTIVACLYAYLMRNKGMSAEEIYLKSMHQLHDAFSKCPKSKYRQSPENDMQRRFILEFIENECV